MQKFENPSVRTAPAPKWDATHYAYVTGAAALTSLDLVAQAAEAKWGADRLRLLIPESLRARFDSQRLKTNAAIERGSLEDLRREATRMQAAWRAADAAATGAGASILPADVWEVTLDDGSVAAIVRDEAEIGLVAAEGRQVAVYSLAEIGRLLSRFPALSQAKETWPGARVTALRNAPRDPLDVWHG